MERAVDVSVLVPCYNTERYVDQALLSAEQNSRCSLEILALNDGSSDGSLNIMRRHEARDARVRVIDKPNQGYGATLNRGIAEARGTYVAVLEPDDWVMPHMYDELFELARKHSLPDAVRSSYWRVFTRGDLAGRRAYGYVHGRVGHTGTAFTLVDEPQLIQYHPAVWSGLYRREFLWEKRIAFVEAPGAGWVDNPFSVHVLAAADSIAYTDEAYYCYREDLAEASSAHVPFELMCERWLERQDILESLNVVDDGVLYANYVVGLRFLGRMLDDGRWLPEAIDYARSIARRMRPELLAQIDELPPALVARTLELTGSDLIAPSGLRYKAHLAREAFWALRYNGLRFLLHNLTKA